MIAPLVGGWDQKSGRVRGVVVAVAVEEADGGDDVVDVVDSSSSHSPQPPPLGRLLSCTTHWPKKSDDVGDIPDTQPMQQPPPLLPPPPRRPQRLRCVDDTQLQRGNDGVVQGAECCWLMIMHRHCLWMSHPSYQKRQDPQL